MGLFISCKMLLAMDLWAKKSFFSAVDFKCLTPEHFFCMQISNWVQLWKESKHDENVKRTDTWQRRLFFEHDNFFFISYIYQNSCETEYVNVTGNSMSWEGSPVVDMEHKIILSSRKRRYPGNDLNPFVISSNYTWMTKRKSCKISHCSTVKILKAEWSIEWCQSKRSNL